MRDATIKLKSGNVLCGPIWIWRPEAGFVQLAGEDAEIVRLVDVEEAHVQMWQHAAVGPERVDLLERARREGWDGR